MPVYEFQHPDGRTIKVEGPTPPSEADLDAIFEKAKAGPGFIERNAQTISSMARPALEVGGMLAGGALAGGGALPSGPGAIPAALAGGALGYAGGKSAADLLDRTLGVKSPVASLPAAALETGKNVAGGVAATLPLAAGGVSIPAQMFKGALSAGTATAAIEAIDRGDIEPRDVAFSTFMGGSIPIIAPTLEFVARAMRGTGKAFAGAGTTLPAEATAALEADPALMQTYKGTAEAVGERVGAIQKALVAQHEEAGAVLEAARKKIGFNEPFAKVAKRVQEEGFKPVPVQEIVADYGILSKDKVPVALVREAKRVSTLTPGKLVTQGTELNSTEIPIMASGKLAELKTAYASAKKAGNTAEYREISSKILNLTAKIAKAKERLPKLVEAYDQAKAAGNTAEYREISSKILNAKATIRYGLGAEPPAGTLSKGTQDKLIQNVIAEFTPLLRRPDIAEDTALDIVARLPKAIKETDAISSWAIDVQARSGPFAGDPKGLLKSLKESLQDAFAELAPAQSAPASTLGEQAMEYTKTFRNLPERTTVKDVVLPPKARLRDLIRLRQNIDDHLRWGASGRPDVPPIGTEDQGFLKQLRERVNGVIEKIPGGAEQRLADSVYSESRQLYDEFQKTMATQGKAEDVVRQLVKGGDIDSVIGKKGEFVRLIKKLEQAKKISLMEPAQKELAARDFRTMQQQKGSYMGIMPAALGGEGVAGLLRGVNAASRGIEAPAAALSAPGLRGALQAATAFGQARHR